MSLVVINPALTVDLKSAQQAVADGLPRPESPPILTKAKRFAVEAAAWVKAGGHISTRAVREFRGAACMACPYYNPRGNLWLGECQAPGCGCSSVKRWMLEAQCPHPAGSRWSS